MLTPYRKAIAENAPIRTAKNGNRKSRPSVVETEERRSGNKPTNKDLLPLSNHTSKRGDAQGYFAARLLRGAENALPLEHLSYISGLTKREVQRRIAAERSGGAVILSGNGGFFLPDFGDKGKNEAAAFVSSIYAKALHTLLAAKSARAYLARLEGQTEIGDGCNAKSESGEKL